MLLPAGTGAQAVRAWALCQGCLLICENHLFLVFRVMEGLPGRGMEMVLGRTSLCPWCVAQHLQLHGFSRPSELSSSHALQIVQVIPDAYLVLPPAVINSLSHIHTLWYKAQYHLMHPKVNPASECQ